MSKKLKITLFLFLIVLLSINIFSGTAAAADIPYDPGGGGCNVINREITNPTLSDKLLCLTGSQFFSRFISSLITLGFIIATIVTIFLLIAGGIKWITSAGDKAQLESARKTITSAVIGLVIVFCVYAILRLIGYFFGIDLIVIDISNLIL